MVDNNEHPFLDPLWRRVVLVGVCLAWALAEFLTGTPGWGMIALAFAGYAYWRFIRNYVVGKSVGSETDGRDGKES